MRAHVNKDKAGSRVLSKEGRPKRQRIDRPWQQAAALQPAKEPAEPGIRPVGLVTKTTGHRGSGRCPQSYGAAAAVGTRRIRKAGGMGGPDGRQEAAATSGEAVCNTTAARSTAGTTGASPPSRGNRRAGAASNGRKSAQGRAAQARIAPRQAGKAGQAEDRNGESSGPAGLSGWQRPAPTPARPGPSRSRRQMTTVGTRSAGGTAGVSLHAVTPAAPGPATAASRRTRAGAVPNRATPQPQRARAASARPAGRRGPTAGRKQRQRAAIRCAI